MTAKQRNGMEKQLCTVFEGIYNCMKLIIQLVLPLDS
jgi:hypothetical protein